jgi:hypothetical protein
MAVEQARRPSLTLLGQSSVFQGELHGTGRLSLAARRVEDEATVGCGADLVPVEGGSA